MALVSPSSRRRRRSNRNPVETIAEFARENRDAICTLLRRYFALQRPFLLQSDLRAEFSAMEETLQGTALAEFVWLLQEAAFNAPWACFALRTGVGQWCYVRVHADHLMPEQIGTVEFLQFKETLAGSNAAAASALEIVPSDADFPVSRKSAPSGRAWAFSIASCPAICSATPRRAPPGCCIF